MKIIRFLNDHSEEQYGVQHDDGSTTALEGDIYGEYRDTGAAASVKKLLAPIKPVDILCIGLHYVRHAQEGNSPPPEHPVLFMKTSSSVSYTHLTLPTTPYV